MSFTPIVMFAVLAFAVTAEDVCLDHADAEPLQDLDRRSSKYSAATSDTTHPILEDRGIDSGAWYSTFGSLETQYLMTDKNNLPPVVHCGTYYPIYLNGDHPELQNNQEVELEACVVDFVSNCSDTHTVKIRRCDGSYQYQMDKSTSNSAYCFDHPLMNDPATAIPDYSIPELRVNYELKYNEMAFGAGIVWKPYYVFSCEFQTPNEFVYRVDWYVNNQLILETGPVKNTHLDSLRLSESVLLDKGYRLGISIKCSARVANSNVGLSTVAKFSEGFFAGAEVSTATSDSVLNLEAGQEGEITITTTLPVGLQEIQHLAANTEGAIVQMYDPTEDYTCTGPSIAALGKLGESATCGTIIPPFKYSDVLDAEATNTHRGNHCQQPGCKDYHVSSVKFKVATSGDAEYGAKDTFSLRLRIKCDHPIWDDYKLPEVTVNVHDDGKWQAKTCTSRIDPHMRTADGILHENQDYGTYLLYRNKKYDTEVQQKNTVACGRAVCTCSVIVRSGGDMFQINACSGKRIIDYITCQEDQQVLDVRRITNVKYRITTPIGTYVEIDISTNRWLNIAVYMAPKDLGNVEGLCGDFDGVMKNDLRMKDGSFHADPPNGKGSYSWHPKTFTQNWKLEGESFWLRQNQSPERWHKSKDLCVCPYIKDALKAVALPVPDDGDTNTALCAPRALNCHDKINEGAPSHVRQCHIRNKRRKRSALTSSEEDTEEEVIEKRSVPDDTTPTTEEGLQACLDYIQGDPLITAYRNTVPGGERAVTQALEECAADYQYNVTDDAVKAAHLELAKSAIQNDILRNKTLQDDSPEIKTAFQAAYCPEDCSGHGTCSGGTCVCEEGFSGSACSDDPSQAVAVLEIEGGETCDLQDEDCDTLRVAAELVLEPFKCRFTETHKYIDSAEETVYTYDTKGTFVSIYAADCPRQTSQRRKRSTGTTSSPFFTIIDVSVSNDGATFGGSGRVYLYDSQCQFYTTQNGQPTIALNEGTCFIDGVCRTQGEVSTSDPCYACDSTTEPYIWTAICTSAEPTNPDNKEALIIGLSVAGGVLLLLIVVVITIAVIKRVNKRKRCPSPGPGNCRFRSKDISETKVSKVNENLYETPLPSPDKEYSMISLHVTDSNYANMM